MAHPGTDDRDCRSAGGAAASAHGAPGDRRPSVTVLQKMLKKVSQSTVHHQYQNLVSSVSDSSESSVNESGRKPESGSKGLAMDASGGTSEELNLDFIFLAPPEFQSSPLDPHSDVETVGNGAKPSELPKDPFKALTPDPFQMPPNASTKNYFNDITLNSPDLFKPVLAPTPHPPPALQLKSSDLLEGEGVDLLLGPKGGGLLLAERTREPNLSGKPPSVFGNSFESPSNEDDRLFRAPKPAYPFGPDSSRSVNPRAPFMFSFHDVFSSSSAAVDPFPSPIARDLLFRDVSGSEDPFGATPSRRYDPFRDVSPGAPDIFRPFPSETDVFGMTSGNTAAAAFSPPSADALSPLPVSEATTPEPRTKPLDVFLTTPRGTEVDILEPSPFTRSRNHSMNHVSTFKRPPKPVPRSRTPRTETPKAANPMKPEAAGPKLSPLPALRLAPKPAPHPKSKTLETKQMEPDDPSVFENVLLTGEERCVEDWPDDSPQLDPDFKPSGKLRLRRESMRSNSASDGGSGDDHEGSAKKKDRKFRLSILSRRDSKEAGQSRSLPGSRKTSKEYFSEMHISAEEDEEREQLDYKKKTLKIKASKIRRASYTPTEKLANGHLPQGSKGEDGNKKSGKKESITRRSSEGKVLEDSTCGEEEEEEEALHKDVDAHGSKKKNKKLKIRFVPQRGFTIVVEKPKGANRYTPGKNSKDKPQEECVGAHGYTPRKKCQDFDDFGEEEERGHRFPSTSKAAFMDDEAQYDMDSCKPKKPSKMKLLHVGLRSSQEDVLDDAKHPKRKSGCSAAEPYDDDWMPDCSPYQFSERGTCATSPGETNDSQEDEAETCKPKKKSKFKVLMKHKNKKKETQPEWEDPPGAASSDFQSEAAQAEWMAAQTDEQAIGVLEDEDEGGDTDSLMEWWNTVEQWDEVPSDDEDEVMREDESRSFTILAGKVTLGLRVFNKVFTERAEVLWQSVISLHAIADNIHDFHQRAKIAKITGGTTTAVGGATAIAGLVLAPFTLGVSLVVTAVGVGVATAGGITSASAAVSDNVNSMQDRKKVEVILEAYEGHLQAIAKILHFVNQGVYKLRGHPFLRSGTQHYSEDWEVRRAVQMINLVDSPVMRAAEVADASIASVQGLFKGMDKCFLKDSRELKKGDKMEVVGQIKEVATLLNDGVMELNALREELQDAT